MRLTSFVLAAAAFLSASTFCVAAGPYHEYHFDPARYPIVAQRITEAPYRIALDGALQTSFNHKNPDHVRLAAPILLGLEQVREVSDPGLSALSGVQAVERALKRTEAAMTVEQTRVMDEAQSMTADAVRNLRAGGRPEEAAATLAALKGIRTKLMEIKTGGWDRWIKTGRPMDDDIAMIGSHIEDLDANRIQVSAPAHKLPLYLKQGKPAERISFIAPNGNSYRLGTESSGADFALVTKNGIETDLMFTEFLNIQTDLINALAKINIPAAWILYNRVVSLIKTRV